MSSAFELRWAHTISEVPPPFWGSFSIFPLGLFLVALSFGASFSSLVDPTFLFMGGGALFFGYEGFFAVYILLCFREHLSHASLKVLRDGKHQILRLHHIGLQTLLRALLDDQ